MILMSLIMCWLLQSMEAALLLSPSGTIFEYVHGTISLTCYEANHEITTFQWNLTPSLNSSIYYTTSEQYSTTLEILDALRILNETVIQCQGNHSNGDIENSSKAKLILQDTPLAVENLKISVDDYSISLTWSAPFMLFDTDRVLYLVNIENLMDSSTTTDITSTTNYVLTSPLHRIACDEFKITITPENWAGLGMNRSVYHINEEIFVTTRTLTLNSMNHFDLLLSVTSPICEITDIYVTNMNLNEMKFHNKFTNFSLIQTFDEGYQYYLKLDLRRRYQYEISMFLENGNSSKYLSFNISTHSVKDVHIEPISSNVLEIEIFYNSYSNTSNQTGAFLSMLHCNTELCDNNEFNPENSLYLSIFETGANIYNITYASGNYLVYLFDTDSDGSLLPSIKSTCVSVFIRRLNLTLYGAQHYVASKKFCEIVYENDTVGSSCFWNKTKENIMVARKQIVLQELTYGNTLQLDTYDPTPISDRDCMRIEKPISYGLIIAVSNYQKDRNIEPIGRRSLSHTSLRSLCSPNNTDTETTETPSKGKGSSVILYIVISIIVSFILLLLLLILLISIVLCLHCCRGHSKNSGGDGEVHVNYFTKNNEVYF